MSNSAKRYLCQCHSPRRKLSGAAVEGHLRAAQRRRDQANAHRKSLGKELLEATVPRPTPMSIGARGRV